MSRKLLNGLRRCSQCGARVLMQGYVTNDRIGHLINTRHICHECAYWTDLMDYPPPHLEVVDGFCVRICPFVEERDPTYILGDNGRKHYFVRPDFSILKSNDVWIIGRPPERFRSHFPNTAKEITREAYIRLIRNPHRCRARACFDRYQCFRYDMSFEGEKPFNEVPKNWKVGNEHCPSFLNISVIFNIKKPIYGEKSNSNS